MVVEGLFFLGTPREIRTTTTTTTTTTATTTTENKERVGEKQEEEDNKTDFNKQQQILHTAAVCSLQLGYLPGVVVGKAVPTVICWLLCG